jgi:hypothetical protein
MSTAVAIASVLLVAGCGSQLRPGTGATDQPQPGDAMPTVAPVASGTVSSGLATVLDAGRPVLCLGAVADSLPPQCSGIPLVGWDWSRWKGLYDQSGETRWGLFAVTGTFDGASFRVTGVVPAASYDPAPSEPTDFSTPCPEPAGGWRVLDPGKTTPATFESVFRTAAQLDGYAGAWMDQSPNPADDDGDPELLNDPALSIVNVTVTGDTRAAEQRLREVWGGMLCVTRAQHTEAELLGIQNELNDLPGMLSSSAQFDRVDVSVGYDDGSLQDWADATYGAGLVHIDSALGD